MSAKKIFKKLGVWTLLLVPVVFCCVKCKPEPIERQYQLAPKDFTINTFAVSTPTVDFTATPNYHFTGSLSHSVTWFIDLKGMSSGAQKRISGTSQTIDGSNPAWTWNGGHEKLYFFKKGEKVAATLSVLGSEVTMSDTVVIAEPRLFGINGNLLVGDFEANSAWPVWIGALPGFFKENPPKPQDKDIEGLLIKEGYNDDPIYPNPIVPFKPVQGNQSYRLAGLDDNGSFFVAGNRREGLLFSSLPEDPSQVYFNVYIFGYGDPNSRMNFGAQEHDNDADPNDPEAQGSLVKHAPTADDEFQIQINFSHVGWKLFSIKYSDMLPSREPLNGGSGNRIHEPKAITGVTFGLISSPSRNYVAATIDYPIITVGGPFDPSK